MYLNNFVLCCCCGFVVGVLSWVVSVFYVDWSIRVVADSCGVVLPILFLIDGCGIDSKFL